MSKKSGARMTVNIEIYAVDGTVQKKSVQIPANGMALKEILTKEGLPVSKHDYLLNGEPIKLNTKIGGKQTVALKEHQKKEAPTVQVKERTEGS